MFVRWYGRRRWIGDDSISLAVMSVAVVVANVAVVVDAVVVVAAALVAVVAAITRVATTVMIVVVSGVAADVLVSQYDFYTGLRSVRRVAHLTA